MIREVGRGGMGIVYEAIHRQLNRPVALKALPIIGNSDQQFIQRFEAEARAAGNLHHTNIVPVFEFGRSQTHHYFTMQLIEGNGLNTYVPTEPRDLFAESHARDSLIQAMREKDRYRAVARIGVQVADAIAYAHQRGVIHRDIKPGNLILDKQATVWVTDFGLAKTPDLDLTQTGTVLGTIRFMAPERLRGMPCDVSGDVYSLGTTLYELLAGRPAFSGEDCLKTISEIAKGDAPSLHTLDRDIPLDLQIITEKAMHHSPSVRYATCDELGADLKRFLSGQPIKARQVRLGEKFLLWSKTNPALAAAFAAIATLLLFIAIGSSSAAVYFYRQQHYQSRLVHEVEVKRAENHQNLYLAEMNLAAPVANSDSGVVRLREILSRWTHKDGEKDLRGWEWFFYSACSKSELKIIQSKTQLSSVAWHPSNNLILTGGPGSVLLWDAVSGEQLWYSCFDEQYNATTSVAWSPDGDRFAAASLSGMVLVWDLNSLKMVSQVRDSASIGSVCWHPSSKALIYRTHAPDVRMMAWNPDSGEKSCIADSIGGDMSCAFGFDRQGNQLASVSANGAQYQVAVWNSDRYEDLFHSAPRRPDIMFSELIWPVSSMSWRPDGKLLAQASFDGRLRFWEPAAKKLVGLVEKSNDLPVLAVEWNPRDPVIATAGSDAVIRLIQEQTVAVHNTTRPLTRPIELKGHTASILGLSWNRDGSQLATVSEDQSLRIWRLQDPAILRGKMPTPDTDARLEWGIYPEHLNVMLAGHRAVWDVRNGEVLDHQYGACVLDSFDGHFRAVDSQNLHYVERYQAGTVLHFPTSLPPGVNGSTKPMQWSPHENDFAFVSTTRDSSVALQVASFASGKEFAHVHPILECERVYAVRWHPTQRWLAVSYYPMDSNGSSKLVVIDAESHQIRHELADSSSHIHAMAWSPDGEQLAYAGQGGII